MLPRDEWLDLARKLDWKYSYVREEEVFPEVASGHPWLPHAAWQGWNEPFRTTYAEYVAGQHRKDASIEAVRDALGQLEDVAALPRSWLSTLKLHAATLP